jgi:hypothetical protein
VLGDSTTIQVSIEYLGITYTGSVSIAKVSDGIPVPLYLGSSGTVPQVSEDGSLIQNDFFLYTGEYIGVNTAPTDKTIDVPTSDDNEFVYGRLYKYVSKSLYACSVAQTASQSIIIPNDDVDLFPVGMKVQLANETTFRTVVSTSAYDVFNSYISLDGALFDTAIDDIMYLDLWRESRDSAHLSVASNEALEIAKNTGIWMYVAVLVVQLGLFQDLLVAGTLKSTNYLETDNVPQKGFLLDGPNDVIKAYAMEAYNSKWFGTVESTGFKTITGTPETIIGLATINTSIYKYSDMTDLISDSNYMVDLAGIVEGYTFTKATKRYNSRILLAHHDTEYEDIEAQELHMFTKVYPDLFFGRTVYISARGFYEGFFSNRAYSVMKPDGYVYKDSEGYPTMYNGYAWSLGTSWSIESEHTLPDGYTNLAVYYNSGALFGVRSSNVEYNRIWTNITFNGIVLRNGNTSYMVYGLQPNAYYPTTKTFTIGANTQDTLVNHYVSGTDFYNLFSALPPLADGYLNTGKIKVQTIGGTLTEYSITHLTKDGNGISFYTGSGVVRINIFAEGTSIGVYEHLEISEAIGFQDVPDGVEVKSVLPWGTLAGSTENVSIGTADSRFETIFSKYLDVLTNALFRGTLNVTGAASMASINTGGLGAFLIGQNLRTTDSPTFVTVNATDVVTTNGPNRPVDNNDDSAPAIGPGGFTFCLSSNDATVNAPSGGTYMYIRMDSENLSLQGLGRIAGGAATSKIGGGTTHSTFFWRLS